MLRYLGLTIGPQAPNKIKRFSLDEVIKISDKIRKFFPEIDGIEIRFGDVRDKETGAITEAGPSVDEIFNALEELDDRFDSIAFHLSEHTLDLLQNGKLGDHNSFLDDFDHVVGHLTEYENLWAKIVDDTYSKTMHFEPYVLRKILVENGSKDSFRYIARFANRRKAAMVYDTGHHAQAFQTVDPKRNKFYDSIKPYITRADGEYGYVSRRKLEWLRSMAYAIRHAHVHGVRVKETDEGCDWEDHVPLESRKNWTTPVQAGIIAVLLDNAPNFGGYTIELNRTHIIDRENKITLDNIGNTMYAFEKKRFNWRWNIKYVKE